MAGLNPGQRVLGAVTPYVPLPPEMLEEHKAGASRPSPMAGGVWGQAVQHIHTSTDAPSCSYRVCWGQFLATEVSAAWGIALQMPRLAPGLNLIHFSSPSVRMEVQSPAASSQGARRADKTRTPARVISSNLPVFSWPPDFLQHRLASTLRQRQRPGFFR